MCSGLERSSNSGSSPLTVESTTNRNMETLTVQAKDSLLCLLELAADNNLKGFCSLVEDDSSLVNEIGGWYGRQRGSKQIVIDQRTPLMVAATYGSIDVMRYILAREGVDVNLSCGMHKTTALHCASSGGSNNAIDVVKILLMAGADPNCLDGDGYRPIDVIVVHPKLSSMRGALECLLSDGTTDIPTSDIAVGVDKITSSLGCCNLRIAISTSTSSSPTLSSSVENGSPPSPSLLISSPMASKFSGKKEYPIDPSLPDIKNSIYSSDEFRMYSFKVRPCSRAYSHDWTECPFVHPGENARRRDPRKFHYSCVPCPEFRKGTCRRGDMCEYAHGVFECWLHPAQYRTRLCKDGTSCNRRVCFFAHTAEELRPLYVSTGSAVPSPRSSASAASVMDMAAALNLLPGSPSAVSAMSPGPFSQSMSPGPFSQSMSHSANGISHSAAWPQPNLPTLHLPGSNLQSSRFRSSFGAPDMLPEDVNQFLDFDASQQILNDMTCHSQARNNSNSLTRSSRSKILTPSNFEELFSSELSSPRFGDQAGGAFSPSQKSAALSQFQHQQAMLSPINTNVFSPKNLEHPLLQASFGVGSPGRMSPRGKEPISPMGSRLSALAQREKQLHQLRSLSSRDLGSNHLAAAMAGSSPANSWSQWGSPSGKADWSVNGDDMSRFQRSSSFHHANNGEEPDVSWVQSLVKESPEMAERMFNPPSSSAPPGGGERTTLNREFDAVAESWLE